MKAGILFMLLILTNASAFGQRSYSLPKSDFIAQLNDSTTLRRVYCFNEKGDKVWLVCNDNTLLVLTLHDGKQKKCLLYTIRYKDANIQAVEFNVMRPSKKISIFPMEQVTSFSIDRSFSEREIPYFNLDSAIQLARSKNDSLIREYKTVNRFVIYVKDKTVSQPDTLTIVEGASYHINFRDKNQVAFGVVQKITADSLYISNALNENMANRNKITYKIYAYAISDMTVLELLHSGGYSFKKLKMENCGIDIKNVESKLLQCPYWFSVHPNTGELRFYRWWLTKRGFLGIAEQDGRAIWYEGG